MYRECYDAEALIDLELRAVYPTSRAEYYVDCDETPLVVRATAAEYQALVWRDYSAAQDVGVWIRDELAFVPLHICARRRDYRPIAELVMQADWSIADAEIVDDELLLPVRER